MHTSAWIESPGHGQRHVRRHSTMTRLPLGASVPVAFTVPRHCGGRIRMRASGTRGGRRIGMIISGVERHEYWLHTDHVRFKAGVKQQTAQVVPGRVASGRGPEEMGTHATTADSCAQLPPVNFLGKFFMKNADNDVSACEGGHQADARA